LTYLIWFLFFLKLLLFWLWLWQLKEYHLGRFFAHFETKKFKKIVSSLWRLKYPKFTLKIFVIFIVSIIFEIILLFYFKFYLAIILSVIFMPLVVELFQLIAIIWRNFVIAKAKKKRAEFEDLLVIGITGSYGKTSTKEFLAKILEEKFGKGKVLKTREHQNSEIGISKCILKELNPQHKVFVVEMAAYNKGGIKFVTDIVKPKIGIVTGVNEQHLSTFGSMENLLSAEGGKELIESLPQEGIAFFNAKNKYCLDLYNKTKIKKFLYGENARNFAEENLSGAIEVAKELGMKNDEIAKSLNFPGLKLKKE
jgi:UDP-N-acetylmuramoyl-tripeptide--D-alanyl-D-alanine ligase